MVDSAVYQAETRDILVAVRPAYLDDQSNPADNYFVWAYTVRIENKSAAPVQLISRHWIITDAMGRTQEVQGLGVVGEQPLIAPGGAYEYTSGTPLPTSSGIMRGTYQMQSPMGERFDVEIPAFSLDRPGDRPRDKKRLN